MGAGKSTVGRLLAEVLGWQFIDVDAEVERRTGRTIPEIFREDGETAFRGLEAGEAAAALTRSDVVIAPGGGWAMAAGAFDALPAGSLVIWLRVTADEAVRRVRRDGRIRPLLEAADPVGAASTLLAAREPFYARAELVIDTGGREPGSIVNEIRERIKNRHGK